MNLKLGISRTIPHVIIFLAAMAILCLSAPVYAENGFAGFDADDNGRLVEIRAQLSYSSVMPGNSYAAALIADIDPGWHINSAHPHQDYLIPAELTIPAAPGVTVSNITYPTGADVSLLGEKMSVYDGRTVIFFQIELANNVAEGELFLPLDFTYQPCNDRECRAPQTDRTNLKIIVGPGGAAVAGSLFAEQSTTQQKATETTSSGEESELQRLIDEHGFWGYFLALGLAFVTGLVLSFSPCTYPMIPITVSIFGGRDRSIGRGFVLSLFYVGSMAVVYGIMGMVVSLVGGVFGAWLASPPVVIGMVVVFVIFALSMFGLFDLNVPMALRQKLGAAKIGEGVGGAILMGVIAALVVSPCVGPFVAGILLYIATYGSPLVGFLILFVFALGLGTLFILIGTFSTAINKLPNSGEWMESVKKFFGFVLLLMALYFLRTLIPPMVTTVVTALLLVAFGVFGGGLDRLTAESVFFTRLKKFLGLLALIVGIYLLLGSLIGNRFMMPEDVAWPTGGVELATKESNAIPWETDLEKGLSRAIQAGMPVMIDTWATWCTNCKVLEKKTFGHEGVISEAGRFVPIKVQLEKADSPATRAFMKKFGMKLYSLPTVLLLNSSGEVRKKIIGVIEPEDMIELMRQTQ